ncbi:hypothetical protein [Nocardioides daeguensis]|uniref:Mammalian cell entry protein n=1 Tax=Nocardioides daeguensis TaxID=908359 RepID=A0ABP6UY85_9ACTN|nr:hypothetical protein [Nocardioides daeguensis]MBV6727087.1 hypothetical protein [Nocardioides daeguensis]MCR1771510.1 hypothetical protein [Nocardioides daeguensis]
MKNTSATLRWSVIGLLLGVVVAALGVSVWTLVDKGAGSNPGKRLDSLIDPPRDESADRELVLAAGKTFVQRFNTYGPDLLDSAGKMPDYAALGKLMTAKFRTVFDKNVGYAEETVKQTQIDRIGTPYAVGVASIDDDSAELLVAGVVQFTAPDPSAPDDASKRVPFEPLRFRYEVSLVKQHGTWLVDDLDDLDDELPSFGEASIPEGGAGAPSGQPSQQPSGAPSPSASTGEGQ